MLASVRRSQVDRDRHVEGCCGLVERRERRARAAGGRVVRVPEHTEALERVVLGTFTTVGPCKPKLNRPPTAAALAIVANIGATRSSEP